MLLSMESGTDTSLLMRIYDNCWRARFLDKTLRQVLPAEFQRSFFSDYGAELGPSITSLLLRKEDYLIPQYRGFSAFLGKGITPERIAGELFRKKIGTTKGLGDSTSFRDPALGIPGYTINLGAMFAVSVGLAFAVKFKNEDRIVAHCFGDGEASRTVFGSALNLASLWELPILFVCFNNGISIETPMGKMSSTKNIADRASGYNLEGETISDTEPLHLYERTKGAIEEIRKSNKPFLLEILGKRPVPHSVIDTKDVNTFPAVPEAEDPVLIFEKMLIEKFNIKFDTLRNLKERAASSVTDAVKRAEASEEPSLEEFLTIYQES